MKAAPLTLAKMPLNPRETALICQAIDVFGTSDHPAPDAGTVGGFAADYVYACLREAWSATDTAPLVNELDDLSGRIFDLMLSAWRATRRPCDDLRQVFPQEWPSEPEPVPGFAYAGTGRPGSGPCYIMWVKSVSDGRTCDAGDMVGRFSSLEDAEEALFNYYLQQ